MSANFGQPNSAFGNPMQPNTAFGQPNLLGGQATGGFGAAPAPQFNSFGSNQPAWGAQPAQQPTPGMGGQWGGNTWGQQNNPSTPLGQPAPGPFSRSVSFGPTSNTSFGQPQQAQPGFGGWGANPPQNTFGATTGSTWGQQSWQSGTTAGTWGGGNFGQQTFGGPAQVGGSGTSGFKFTPVRDTENGTSYTINHLMANQQFIQKSVEEYRLEDYKMNLSAMQKQGAPGGSLFGQTNQPTGLGATPSFGGQTGGSLFGQTQSNLMGQSSMTPGFGAQANQPFGSQTSAFGANQPKPAGSLFGGQTMGTTPGSMFGQTTMGAQPGGGLFGQGQTQGGSMFGQQPQQGQANPLFGGGQQNLGQNKPLFGGQTGGSLFGGQPQGSMMGGQTQPAFGAQPQTGSLFGGQPQGSSVFGSQPQGGSLFSASQPQTTSLFGGQAPSTFGQPSTPTFGQTSTPSLFGQPSTPAQQPQGSLFAPQQGAAPQSVASLFGGAQAATSLFSGTSQAGLFGAKPTSMFGAAPSQPATSTSLFGGTPTSTPSLFGGNQPGGMFGSTSQPSNPLTGGSSLFANPQASSLFVNAGTSLFGQVQPTANAQAQAAIPTEAFQSAYKDPLGLSWLISDDSVDGILQRYQKKLSQPLPSRVSILDRISSETVPKQTSATPDKWRKNWDQVYFSPKKPNLLDITSPKRSEPIYMRKTSAMSDGLNSLSEDESVNLGRSSSTSSLREAGNMNVTVIAYDPNPIHLIIPVTNQSSITEIKEKISKHLTSVDKNTIRLTFKGKVLSESDEIRDCGIKNMDSLTVIFEENSKKIALAPKELLPKLTNPEYTLKPDLVELARMTVDELKRVRNFSISNSYGKIEFEGESDVTGLNLDEIVKIEDKAVTVYPDEHTTKPPVGQGLNKPAVVHLYNCQPKKDMPLDVYEDKIRKMCERRGSEFVSWSRRNFEWVFKVPHF